MPLKPRDPKRIKEVLETIEAIWEEYPDLRLMQLLMNALRMADPDDEVETYYYEGDDELLKGLRKNYSAVDIKKYIALKKMGLKK